MGVRSVIVVARSVPPVFGCAGAAAAAGGEVGFAAAAAVGATVGAAGGVVGLAAAAAVGTAVGAAGGVVGFGAGACPPEAGVGGAAGAGAGALQAASSAAPALPMARLNAARRVIMGRAASLSRRQGSIRAGSFPRHSMRGSAAVMAAINPRR